MKEEQVKQINEVVSGIISDVLTQMIEDMSSNDFIETIMEKLEEEGTDIDLNDEDSFENIKEVVGNTMIPLLMRLSSVVLEMSEEE
jgi:hypothetical protein